MSRGARAATVAALLALAGCGVRPSGVITGGPAPQASGGWVRLYLVRDRTLTPVLRRSDPHTRPTGTLELLLAGPAGDERADGYTTEVPPDLGLVEVQVGELTATVTVAGDPVALSATAAGQITCTVVDAVTTDSQVRPRFTVTLTGPARSRGPERCPRYG
ncbi:GerMN domain-containing protein [Dactylosporangium sucinum]|uniref:GerMN domain-containing protein n=1 Tax=Dactylosporangium sucinum TaxID=1424081 RepID=A0A917TT82_9ACTN|nr:GerMN domain-containing protein [Dactylosporangium sucinum]GGM35127.1 hypothetical protein GCM10007977_040810 [Dactylosporangium sucinum]